MLYTSLSIILQLSLFYSFGYVFYKIINSKNSDTILNIPTTMMIGLSLLIAFLGIVNIFIPLKLLFFPLIIISIATLLLSLYYVFKFRFYRVLLFIPIIFLLSIIAIPSMFHYDGHLYHIYASKLYFEYHVVLI